MAALLTRVHSILRGFFRLFKDRLLINLRYSEQRLSTTSNRFSIHMSSQEKDKGRVTFQTTQQKLKQCLVFLIATVLFGGVTLFCNESSLVPTVIWMAPRTIIPSHNEGTATNSNVFEPGYKLTFSRISGLPYFYKPVSFHSSDKNRQRASFSVDYTHGYRPVTSTKSKLILFHNPPGWFSGDLRDTCQQGLQECSQKNCQCSYDPKQSDKADAVIFDGVELKYRMPPFKKNNQVWILFGIECPFYYNNQLYLSKQWRHVFNWTMTYRLDSDVILPYNVLYQLQQPPKVNFPQIALNKTKSVLWFVSNCNTQSKRQQYVKELRKHIPVDIYGRCGPLKCTGAKCDSLYNQYRFYLSFENSFCVDYITEKLFKVYSHNIVPVVRGGADYNSLVPKGTYINAADFSGPKELATYLKYLETNVTAYAEILENKARYVWKGGTFQSAFCDICMKLHNLKSYRQQYYDSVKWLKQDTCRPPTDI